MKIAVIMILAHNNSSLCQHIPFFIGTVSPTKVEMRISHLQCYAHVREAMGMRFRLKHLNGFWYVCMQVKGVYFSSESRK